MRIKLANDNAYHRVMAVLELYGLDQMDYPDGESDEMDVVAWLVATHILDAFDDVFKSAAMQVQELARRHRERDEYQRIQQLEKKKAEMRAKLATLPESSRQLLLENTHDLMHVLYSSLHGGFDGYVIEDALKEVFAADVELKKAA